MAVKRERAESATSSSAMPSRADSEKAVAAVRAHLRKKGGLDEAEIDELVSGSILRALQSWIPGKSGFATFAVECAKNDAKAHFQGRTKDRQRVGAMPAEIEDTRENRGPAERYFSDQKLWPAVRDFCLELFEETHKRPWEERFAVPDIPPGEEAARDAFQKLRIAARAADDVIKDYPATDGACWRHLNWLRDQQRLLFFAMSRSDADPWPPTGRTLADRRARVAWIWTHASPIRGARFTNTSTGIVGERLQHLVTSDDPGLSNKELAVVSLLCGSRPKVDFGSSGVTLEDVLATEAESMKKAVARHGQRRRDKK